MGIRGGIERAQQVVSGNLTAVSNGTAAEILGKFNLAIFGTFVGTAALQKSYDGGVTWLSAKHPYTGADISVTAPATYQLHENEPGVQYRVACTAFTSGTISYRMSAGMNQAARADQTLS